MGPRLLSRGKRRRSVTHGTRRAASMGPRLLSRGKQDRQLEKTADWDASMGPRLLSRGKAWTCRAFGRLAGSFNGAAAVEPRKAERKAGELLAGMELQWGRGC